MPPYAALPAQVIPDAPAPMPVASDEDARPRARVGGDASVPRRYRVRGLEKNLSYEVLKVNVFASTPAFDGVGDEARGEAIHVDTLDLYQARQRAAFVTAAAAELGVAEEIIKGDIGQAAARAGSRARKTHHGRSAPKAAAAVTIDEGARARAMAWLTTADLTGRIAADFSRCGIVGERQQCAGGVPRRDLPQARSAAGASDPVHLAAGKSSLLDAVLRFVPEEDRIVYSAMTGQSLFYMGEMDLKHKLLAIAEEQGATRPATP